MRLVVQGHSLMSWRVAAVRAGSAALDLLHDFGGKVVLLLFNAFAHFQAHKPDDFGALALEQLANGLVAVLDERLAAQGDFRQELVEPARSEERRVGKEGR